jgi:hypothetical protein
MNTWKMDLNNITLPEPEDRMLDIRPISGWFDEWVYGIKEEVNQISLKFPLFDYEMKGKLRGKLGVIIHYGGTKKSLLAQNITHHNIFRNKHRIIYSSMEMGVVELGSRFIDILCDAGETNASYQLEELHKTKPDEVRKTLSESVAPAYGDRLQITQNSGLTCDEYKILLEKVKPVDVLIVDGLSMMGGKGSELELANLHTRGLKELAKDNNILVLCIVHASRGGEKCQRDVSKFARGSEKIIDNCDFYICPSLIVEDIEGNYRRDIGYLRLVNKRGSGNVVDLIYSFDPKRLLMSQTDHDPKEYDRKMNNKDVEF